MPVGRVTQVSSCAKTGFLSGQQYPRGWESRPVTGGMQMTVH